MIQTDNLCKVFQRTENAENKKAKKVKADFYAVDHVSISAEKGEILGVLGPNGAGKTTLLRMMGMLMQPTEGTVKITGTDMSLLEDEQEIKRRIGYLSGNTKLYHRFSTREMLHMLADIYGIDKCVQDERIERICKLLSMEKFIDNKIERLSTGQTQRANISRCLIHEPDIYIFDEPTLGLDIISSEAIIQFMKREKEANKTILYSTHYMEEAQYLCDKIVMMYQGKVIASGTPEALMDMTKTENLRETFRALVGNTQEERETKEDKECDENE